MIKITKENNKILFKGHTLPDICSGVSCIMYTTVNALKKYENKWNRGDILSYEDNLEDDYVSIKILKSDDFIDLLIENMFDMLNQLKEDGNDDKIEIEKK